MLEIRPRSADCATRRTETACVGCGARAFSVCGRLAGDDLVRLNALAEPLRLRPGEILAREDDPATAVFNITSGSVRVFRLLPDGRRQITGFLFAGDFLGLAASERYAFSAEAIEPTTACRFRRTDYRALVEETPELEAALLERVMHELAVAQEQMVLLGRKTALERVATFLRDLPAHDPMRPASPGQVRLPMTRAEIADYLGLTIETVSRVLTRLKTSGVIRLLSLHELKVERPDRLDAMANGDTDGAARMN